MMADISRRQARKNKELERIICKEQERAKVKLIRKILRKQLWERTEEELKILEDLPGMVCQVQERMEKHHCLKERTREVTDPLEVFVDKCYQLAQTIRQGTSVVVYTGAGISTAASIPDYRGPDGVWTLLQKGRKVQYIIMTKIIAFSKLQIRAFSVLMIQDLSIAEPTYTHMAIKQLHKEGLITHVVSQNCDGLHLRSGLPRKALSEVHGNMFIEVCPKCKPLCQYVRLFDVTEHTGLHRHKTGRTCYKCGVELIDTIVHFGERGTMLWPLNWKGAAKAVDKTDTIICLGSSLKVLKRYHCLWATDRPFHKRPKLFIVNLQWTPKDIHSTLKINGKCDDVMKQVMSLLGIEVPEYKRENDPIFKMAIPLTPEEEYTTTRTQLVCPEEFSEMKLDEVKQQLQSIKPINVDLEHSYAKMEIPHNSNNNASLIERTIKIESDSNEHGEFTEDSTGSCETKLLNNPTFLLLAEPVDTEGDSNLESLVSKIEADNDMHTISGTTKDLIPEENEETNKLSGWFGKGYAKWKKPKKRKL